MRGGCGVEGCVEEGGNRPSHTLRCCTPSMGCSEDPAMHQNSMRCFAMHFPTCWKSGSFFCNFSAIYSPIFKRLSAKCREFDIHSCDI